MSGTQLGLWALDNSITLSWIGLQGLANGSVAATAAFDNTEATIGSAAYDLCHLLVNLGAPTTVAGAGVPNIQAVATFAVDGTNYEAAYASAALLYPTEGMRQKAVGDGATVQFLLIQNIPLLSSLAKINLLNELGVAFPASGVTANLYRDRGRAG